IFLGIAAVHAQSMQLHEFASVIFIQTAALALGLISCPCIAVALLACFLVGAIRNSVSEIGVGPDAKRIVEIEQHSRALCGCSQQVFELAQGTRPNDVTLVAGEQVAIFSLADKYVEVIEPEIGHYFLQLAL